MTFTWSHAKAERTRQWIGILGIALLALGIGPSSAAIGLGYALLIVFMLASWRELASLWNMAWEIKALVLLTLYVLTQGLLTGWARPELAFDSGDLQHMLRTVALGTVAVGWAVYATRLSPRLICVLALVGFAVATAEAFLEHGPALLEINRLHYLRSPNEVGLFGGTVALGAFFFGGSYVVSAWRAQRHLPSAGVGTITVALLMAGMWVWIQSGSRSAWLGLLAAIVVAAAVAIASALVARRHVVPVCLGLTIGAVVVVASVMHSYEDITPRIEQDLPSLRALTSEDRQTLSLGLERGYNPRFTIWAVAVEDIKPSPLIGMGAGYVTAGFERIEEQERLREGLGHYHNLYLHLAVFIGVPAVLVWLATLTSLTVRTFRMGASRQGRDSGLAWFLMAWVVFFAVTSIFQVRMHSAYGAAYFAVFSGVLLGTYLRWRVADAEQPAEASPEIRAARRDHR